MKRAEADRRAHRLLRWYPRTLRLRYGEEFKELLIADISERPWSLLRTLDVVRSGLAARVTQQPLPRLRIAAAVLILGAAFAGAALLHWHQFVYSCPPESLVLCRYTKTPGWVDPTALAICMFGVAGAAGLLLTARRKAE